MIFILKYLKAKCDEKSSKLTGLTSWRQFTFLVFLIVLWSAFVQNFEFVSAISTDKNIPEKSILGLFAEYDCNFIFLQFGMRFRSRLSIYRSIVFLL